MKILQTKAADLFGKLDPEKEKELKNFKIERTPALDAIVKGFEHYLSFKDRFADKDDAEKICYKRAMHIVPVDKCTPKNIEHFSLMLNTYQKEKDFVHAGFYLSALVNSAKQSKFIIHTEYIASNIDDIGYANIKHIVIKGSVGAWVGDKMHRGRIIIEGNAGFEAGSDMTGGELLIHGNSGNLVGAAMKGGKILVDGNVGTEAGRSMEDGKVIVKGDAGNRAGYDMQGGKLLIHGNSSGGEGENMGGGLIVIKGNAGHGVAGDMMGGKLLIHGNAGDYAGKDMTDGIVIIEGNAGKHVGENTGNEAEIHINGEIGSLGDNLGCRIYHKGKLLRGRLE